MPNRLTLEEIALCNKLGDCWNDFTKLARYHPACAPDFAASIHALQRIVMSRLAVRTHPELFTGSPTGPRLFFLNEQHETRGKKRAHFDPSQPALPRKGKKKKA